MKSRFIKSACSIITAILVFITGIAFAVYAEEYAPDSVKQEIISSRLNETGASDIQSFIDGWMTENAGDGSAEWYAFCLAKDGVYDLSGYAAVLETKINSPKLRATDRQRIALAYNAAGGTGIDMGAVVDETWNQLGIMSEIYSLILLNSGDHSCGTDEAVIVGSLLDRQLSDGGWALGGQYSDADVTAMALQALSAYKSSPAVSQSIESAVSLLSAMQRSDGSYQSYGTSCAESCAQVIIALEQLGIDPLSDSRFIKNGCTAVDALMTFQNETGAFAHISGGADNAIATVQAYEAFTALSHSGLFELRDKTVEIEIPEDDETPEPTVQPTAAVTKPAVKEPQAQTAVTTAAVRKPSGSTSVVTAIAPEAGIVQPEPEEIASAPQEEAPAEDVTEAESETASDAGTTEAQTETTAAAVTSTQSEPEKTSLFTSLTALQTSSEKAVITVTTMTDTPEKTSPGGSWKTAAYIVIALLFAASVIYPIVRKSFLWKKTAVSAVLCLAAAGAVFFIKIQTPEEYYSRNLEDIGPDSLTVTLSVSCETIADELDGDHVIIPETELVLIEGESVFDILERVLAYNRIPFEYNGNFETDIYIEGINNIYEMDYGEMSGWMYFVNGETPDVGCGAYIPEDGDLIEWKYTRETGHDLGLEEFRE